MSSPQRPRSRRRPTKNTFTTKSGQAIKLHRSLTERFKARRDAKARRRAAYLATLPKNRFKRILYRLHPKRQFQYWFSRDGAIMALKITGIGIVVCFMLIVGLFAYFRKDLPNINDISGSTLPGSTNYYDRTGEVLLYQDYEDYKRIQVEGEKIAQNMKDATIAIEDKNFYKHGAFDMQAIIRAGFNDVFNKGGTRQGGSTITQQLVKLNQEWTTDVSYTRKIKELILSVELEREYSKEDILTGYLNSAPYGPVQWGVQTAAQEYFGIDATDLNVAQAAMLSAIPKSPNVYSPYGPLFTPEDLMGRTHYIIDQMFNQKMISEKERDDAKSYDLLSTVKPPSPSKYDGIKAPYFVLAAKQELITKFGAKTVNRGGWKVITTVDLNLQGLAEKSVADAQKVITGQRGKRTAFAAQDNKTGQMVALVGGTDFRDPKFGEINFASRAHISPGSTFKPYDYVTFIENNNAGAGSVLYDQQGFIPGWPCTDKSRPTATGDNSKKCLWDYDFYYPGPTTLRYALGGSRNVPAVKAMMLAQPNDPDPDKVNSIRKTIETAEALMNNKHGYRCYETDNIFEASDSDETKCFASAAIGDGAYLYLDDHANGIASISRMGVSIPKTYILKITNSNNKTFYEFEQPAGKQVVRPDAAYIVNDMAADPKASYLPGSCTETNCTPLRNFGYKFHRFNGWHFAIKTGTTNDAYDGLMASWSNKYTAVTWVGVDTRTPPNRMSGSMETMTAPIIRSWMEGAHGNLTADNWKPPSGVKTLPAYVMTKKASARLYEAIPSRNTDLFPSWYQPPKAGGNANQTIDTVSNKVATSCTPELAKKTEGGGNHSLFSVDYFVTGAAVNNSTAADDVHNCNDTKPSVTLQSPDECEDADDCVFTVTYTQGTHPISSDRFPGTINLVINGQKIETKTVSDSFGTVSFTYDPPSPGLATIEAQVIDSVLYSAAATSSVTFTD
jgi:membrane peptidoglycan carboxypeptidase